MPPRLIRHGTARQGWDTRIRPEVCGRVCFNPYGVGGMILRSNPDRHPELSGHARRVVEGTASDVGLPSTDANHTSPQAATSPGKGDSAMSHHGHPTYGAGQEGVFA